MPLMAFLHTAEVHVATFEALLADAPDVTTRHVVRPDLLALAQTQGLTAVRALLCDLPVPLLSAPRLAVGAAMALMRSPRHP